MHPKKIHTSCSASSENVTAAKTASNIIMAATSQNQIEKRSNSKIYSLLGKLWKRSSSLAKRINSKDRRGNKYLASFNQFLKQTTSLDMNTKNVYALPGLNCINQIQLSGRRASSGVQIIKKALRITRICPRVTPCITWFHLECQRPGSISSSSNLQEGLKLQKYE